MQFPHIVQFAHIVIQYCFWTIVDYKIVSDIKFRVFFAVPMWAVGAIVVVVLVLVACCIFCVFKKCFGKKKKPKKARERKAGRRRKEKEGEEEGKETKVRPFVICCGALNVYMYIRSNDVFDV